MRPSALDASALDAMKLGYIHEPQAVNSSYRVIMPMLALERRGHTIAWSARSGEDVPMKELARCDLVHCFRRPDRISDLRRLAAHGVAITFDNDDDLRMVDVSSAEPGKMISGARGRLENMRKFSGMLKIMRFADLTTTPSELLADTYRQAGASEVTVIENYLDDRSIPGYGSRTSHEGIAVGWVASKEHELDLSHLPVADALAKLLERYPQLRVVTVGSRLRLDSPRYEYRKAVRFVDLVGVCAGFDIGIAPLLDTPFNRARSNVKLKEYAAGGAAWLASAVGPYRGMGRREGGSLVDGDRWFEALDALMRSGFARRRLSRSALKWAQTQTLDNHVHRWEQAFARAIQRAQTRASSRPA
jgi:glycosyltransferase involved in cell wall biosynthesis